MLTKLALLMLRFAKVSWGMCEVGAGALLRARL